MIEKTVNEAFNFLCKKHEMNYTFTEFENYLGKSTSIETYSYYNADGCFTITSFAVRGEIEYIHLDDIRSLKDYLFSDFSGDWNLSNNELRRYYDEKLSRKIRIFEYEPEVWKKHRIKLFFGGYKKELQVLSEVIRVQIEKHGEFFGIKVNK